MADNQAQEQQQQHEQHPAKTTKDHIPMTNQDEDSAAEEDTKNSQKGLLSKVGDPVGTVLNTALRPIGAPLEKCVTGPLGTALGNSTTRPALGPLLGHADERSELLGGKNADSYAGPAADRIAGREQTGENPLGLDQSGRWGFEEEEEEEEGVVGKGDRKAGGKGDRKAGGKGGEGGGGGGFF